MHQVDVGAHGVDLESGLHDAAVELVLVEVPHQQAPGEKIPERRVVAHACGKSLLGVQHQLLHEFRPQGHHELLEGEGGLGYGAVFAVVLIEHFKRLEHEAEGFAEQGQAVTPRNMVELCVVLEAGVFGQGKVHGYLRRRWRYKLIVISLAPENQQ